MKKITMVIFLLVLTSCHSANKSEASVCRSDLKSLCLLIYNYRIVHAMKFPESIDELLNFYEHDFHGDSEIKARGGFRLLANKS